MTQSIKYFTNMNLLMWFFSTQQKLSEFRSEFPENEPERCSDLYKENRNAVLVFIQFEPCI